MGTVWCLGSVNVDHSYALPHLPGRGETLAADAYRRGLGGKGANQSVAAARAGARVRHVGAVGPDGAWACDRLAAFGVDVSGVAEVDAATGHAVIWVGPDAENVIVIHPGANRAFGPAALAVLEGMAPGDWLMMQNETGMLAEAAAMARARGVRVAWSAAPFDIAAAREMLGLIDLLLVNAVEAAQLEAALGRPPAALCPAVVVTRGSAGAEWQEAGREPLRVPAVPAAALDTTGAGDCLAGNLVARLAAGDAPADALRWAAAAASVQVERPGAAEAMPTAAETEARLARQ